MLDLHNIIIRDLGKADYQPVWQAMQAYTADRDQNSPDQIWLVEHPPVFTQGQAGKAEHILNAGDIPVIQTDRGGQVTYHGPGQLVAYFLIDLPRRKFGVRTLVSGIENAVIAMLKEYAIEARARCDAPGVYVEEAKICSLGLRIRHGRSYHGLALNVTMDLSPFKRINPCGFQQMQMTQMADFLDSISLADVAPRLVAQIQQELGYTSAQFETSDITQPHCEKA